MIPCYYAINITVVKINNYRLLINFFFRYLIIFCFLSSTSFASPSFKTKIQIENQIITSSEIKYYSDIIKLLYKHVPLNFAHVTNQLINNELKILEAKSLLLEVDEKIIDRIIKKNTNKELQELFKKDLKYYQMYRRIILGEILWSKIINNEISSRIRISEKELEEFSSQYESVKNLLLFSKITFADKKEAENVFLKIKNDNLFFEKLDKLYPEFLSHTDIGWIDETDIMPRLFSVISNLKVNEISEPFSLDKKTYTIYKLEDKKKLLKKNIDKVVLKKKLKEIKLGSLIDEYIVYLRKKYFYDIKVD